MASVSFSKKELWGHPVGLYVLSATEMWERLSYYGMAAILALYLMTADTLQAMGWEHYSDGEVKKNALWVVGYYLMFVYLTPMLGGYIADRFWGQRRSILVGGFMMMIGKFLLATPFMFIQGFEPIFVWSGIALSVLGNGFFKPNISTIVGDLYSKDDPRRDSAFTIFYMGINFGACIAFLVVGYIGEMISYQLAFFVTGIGMGLGLIIQMIFAQKTLGDIGKEPKHKFHNMTKVLEKKIITAQEKLQIGTILFFSCLSIIFWMGFEQSTGSLTFFAKEQTDLVIMGYEIPASWLRAANPFFIFLMAPLLSALWMRMGKNQPDALGKYAYGFLLMGVTFLIPAVGASMIGAGEKAHIMWLVMTYFVMTISEIFISPVGLSVVTFYSPARFLGLMMGVWFLCAGLGGKISAWVGSFIVDVGYVSVFLGTSSFCFLIFLVIIATRKLSQPLLQSKVSSV